MEQLNRIEIRGNVGNVRIQNVGGRNVAKLTVATNLAYKAQDGCAVIETTWHNVTAFEGKEIHDLEKIEKGSRVHVVGRIRNQRYTGADGESRYCTEVLANSLSILNGNDTFQCQM